MKTRIIHLYHSYLSYKLKKQCNRYFRTKDKIDLLETKYMGVERVSIDWEQIEKDAVNNFEVFENLNYKEDEETD